MISIILVSHEKSIVTGTKKLVNQMCPDIDMLVSGGTSTGEIGTNSMDILSQIEAAKYDEIALFFDIGSSYISSTMALEFYTGDKKVHFMDYPLVEGAFVAGVRAMSNGTIAELINDLVDLKISKIPK